VGHVVSDDEAMMRRALAAARDGDSPIGCVIVWEGRVVAEAANEVARRHDPTAHAEIVAIRRACESLGRDDLRGATLYSTLQPCGMCSMASIWASVTRVVFGARRRDVHRMYFEDRHLGIGDIVDDAWRNDVRIVGGVLAAECAAPLYGPDDTPPAEEQANV
jgi:tRNA(adenine34) deaminase